MAGGKIFEKQIVQNDFQGTGDKNLIINSNYAYVAPFDFPSDGEGSWNEIQLGVFMSFVQAGDGNQNVGFPSRAFSSTFPPTEQLGASANDEFFYFGLVRTGETQSLPLGIDNSGFIGMRGDAINFRATAQAYHNRIINISECGASSDDPDALFFTSTGSSMLEQNANFDDHRGNWVCIGLDEASIGTSSSVADFGSSEKSGAFMSYWGARFKVINKDTTDQKINFVASTAGKVSSALTSTVGPMHTNVALSDPSTGALSNFLDSANTFVFNSGNLSTNNFGHRMHTDTDGFKWNNGGAPLNLPNALYIYNGFSTVRPRIHAWGVKVIS